MGLKLTIRNPEYPAFLATGVPAALAVYDKINKTKHNSSQTQDEIIEHVLHEMMQVTEFTYQQLEVSTGYYEMATMYFLYIDAYREYVKQEKKDYQDIYRGKHG